MTDNGPSVLILDEARRVVLAAQDLGLSLRLLGGIGIADHDHVEIPTSLIREYGDIDCIVKKRDARDTSLLFHQLGYVANDRFNAIHGARRLLFYDEVHGRQVDVFVGSFMMCHDLPLEDSFDAHQPSLSAADLLLTKLQIVELNDKDALDIVRIFFTHELVDESTHLGGSSCEGLAMDRVRRVTAADWGWYTTATDNLEKIAGMLHGFADDIVRTTAEPRIRGLHEHLEAAPKSMKWKARSVVGRRKPWYELPEDIG